jgi:ribosomal protein S12 methylthiotransferase accessory factor YcaO
MLDGRSTAPSYDQADFQRTGTPRRIQAKKHSKAAWRSANAAECHF